MKTKLFFVFLFLFMAWRNDTFSLYRLTNAFPNLTFSLITEMAHSYDGTNRIFIVQQRGIIYVFPNSSSASNPKVFINLSDRVSQSGSETGLLGLTFHPNYENNRYFYVNYTTQQPPLRTIIARFTTSPTNPDSALISSELILMTVAQPFTNHNGGKVDFGPDNYLYISLGDGGSGGDPMNNGQNRAVLLGKILRINVDSFSGGNNYSIPPTNPYYQNTQGFREEIFVYGLRNVWKFSFDIPTNRIWAGDVGQNAWEEIDVIQNGKNYGWRIMEGGHCYNPPTGCDTTGLTFPVWEYSHTFGCSVTGGYVYRGPTLPPLTGKYIYGDYCSGIIWALTYDGINPPTNELVFDSTLFISSFGIDQNNELYVCSYTPGRIYKIIQVPIGINNNSQTPALFELKQNYPNPFNPITKIIYSLPEQAFVSLKVFNVLSIELESLVNEMKDAGNHEVDWNASNYPSGVYFYRITAGDNTDEKKMVLLK